MGYKDLDVWKLAMDLCCMVYETTRTFPREEQFGITTQLRLAAVSIPANIAEGYGRRSPVDYSRFLRVAKGSTNELETLLILSHRVGILPQSESHQEMTRRVGSMLSSLIKSVEGGVVREINSMYGDVANDASDN